MRRHTVLPCIGALVLVLSACSPADGDGSPSASAPDTVVPNDLASCVVGTWDLDAVVDVRFQMYMPEDPEGYGEGYALYDAVVDTAEGTHTITFSEDGTYSATLDTTVVSSWTELGEGLGDVWTEEERRTGTYAGSWKIDLLGEPAVQQSLVLSVSNINIDITVTTDKSSYTERYDNLAVWPGMSPTVACSTTFMVLDIGSQVPSFRGDSVTVYRKHD